MNFTIKHTLLVTAWLAWCIFAVQAGWLWVWDVTNIIGWLAISSSIALPLTCVSTSRSFWSAYACTTAVFLLLATTNNETVIRTASNVAGQLVGAYVALFGNGEGVGNAYLKTNIVADLVKLHSVPLLGVLSALSHNALMVKQPVRTLVTGEKQVTGLEYEADHQNHCRDQPVWIACYSGFSRLVSL